MEAWGCAVAIAVKMVCKFCRRIYWCDLHSYSHSFWNYM